MGLTCSAAQNRMLKRKYVIVSMNRAKFRLVI